jgi:hypothetical protein
MAIGSYTRAQIRAKIQAKLDSSPFWTATEINDAVNEAMQVYGLMTGLWKVRTTAVTVASDNRIQLDPAYLRPFRITVAGAPLMQATLTDLDNARPNWENESTTSGGDVPTTVRAWIPTNWTIQSGSPKAEFAIWPTDDAGGTTLTIDAYATPPVLANDSDVMDIDDADLEAVMAKALIILSFKKPASLKAGLQAWQGEFSHMIAVRNARLAASDQFKKIYGNPQEAQHPMRVEERVKS